MYKIIIQRSADKELDKIQKGNKSAFLNIIAFLDELKRTKQPKLLKNATKMQGYDERYRWRVGNYRIIGLIKDKQLIIEIIKISSREGAYKGS